ncbi:MAG: hypothetical protein H0T62_09565 [Parachlamydiaceae bacterium]|nr:hypothetical protein [Parachlamydiaceae bacterium]
MKEIPDADEISQADLILSANRALQCEIRQNMRRISVEYHKEEKKIIVFFFYDTSPSQDDLDYDVEGTITAEMSADFPSEIEWEERSIVLAYPNRLPSVGICVFRRYEPSPPET